MSYPARNSQFAQGEMQLKASPTTCYTPKTPMNTVNACFEAVAAVLAWMSVRRLLQAQCLARGIYLPSLAFSCVWGIACVPYYLSHGDHLSLVGASVRDAANLTWLTLAWRGRQ